MRQNRKNMMRGSASVFKKGFGIAALMLLFVSMLSAPAGATDLLGLSSLCSTGLQSNVFGNVGTAGPFNSLVIDTLLIMLFLINVAIITYVLGSAFNIQRLANFGKAEVGEVIITLVIVFVFLGTFQAITFNPIFGSNQALAPTGNFFAVSPTVVQPTTFQADCNQLASASGDAIGNLFGLLALQEVTQLVSSLNYKVDIGEGLLVFSAAPFAGLSGSYYAIDQVSNIGFLLVAFPFAVSGLLWVFFALFPIFFYIGIIFRSFPWTRAAGGSFLGLFLAFYLMFPTILYLLISAIPPTSSLSITAAQGTPLSIISRINPLNILTGNFASLLGFQVITTFIQESLSQVLYLLIAVLISFIVSFDFMEAVGDLLGAPSLRSDNTLRKVI